ncbi:MAG TPA: DUF4256 domain-containing protein [Cryomorphaceae bacterium]|nr:hypothetical protein [Owenweeksia sp.]HAD97423.1 DUF4256 domain-containing protein [Cryomorphaceae bacterium]HBF20443.1 DUF4256 domain-containing protein [Cryomorphaceae bacterium]|tara:strand:- start:1486 stop:2052 length:567 start_codon:yes stop_codon:yes gene_type:complete
MKNEPKELSPENKQELLDILESRFRENLNRHKDMDWAGLKAKLEKSPRQLLSLYRMESTGGEPDVVGYDQKKNEYIFFDCSKESPDGRRSLCYDRAALDARKKNKPENSALDIANEIGINILTEDQYHRLQELGDFDTKTSSWIQTPSSIRERGGAIFGDFRFGRTFIYHNGADSYYAARGFRGELRV